MPRNPPPDDSGVPWFFSDLLASGNDVSTEEKAQSDDKFDSQPADTSGVPDDKVDTEPIPIIAASANETLQPLSPALMSNAERRDIQLEAALHGAKMAVEFEFFKAKQQLKQKYFEMRLRLERGLEPSPPDEYAERLSVWRMILLQLIPAVGLVLAIILTLLLFRQQALYELWGAWYLVGVNMAMIIMILACLWFGFRNFVIWKTTILYSNVNETGIRREPVAWLAIGNIDDKVTTNNIQTKKSKHPWILWLLHINSHTVTLDVPAEEDGTFLRNKHFVQDGDRLLDTVTQFQEFLRLNNG